ncbi:MAG TPA: hypothetical protein VFH56_14380 [Acidimicrobiales bacterium]|nr:hypothetical protein [Acidimicrobiales bacterium]
MTTFDGLVTQCQQALQGYGLSQPRAAFISTVGGITAADLSFTVDDATDLSQGAAEIEDEIVFIQSVDTATNTVTVAPDGRGWYGTTAATHAANTRLTFEPVWFRQRIKTAINDTIIGTWPMLFGVGTTSFTYNTAVNTYELPTDAERVLKISATTFGPTREQQQVKRYRQALDAPTAEFTSGKTVTIEEPCYPGATVTVTYMKAPAALVNGSDDLTSSGLRETAKQAVLYGACAELVSFMDPDRLAVDSATAQMAQYSYRSTGNQVGAAAQIASQLTARYQFEVQREQRRLREVTPVPVNVRVR